MVETSDGQMLARLFGQAQDSLELGAWSLELGAWSLELGARARLWASLWGERLERAGKASGTTIKPFQAII